MPLKPSPKTEWLDHVLADQPAETKARVLEFVVKFGGDLAQDSDFWIVFAAIGYLQVLVIDSPQEWQQLFQSFSKELEEWATVSLQKMALMEAQTSQIETLATSSATLTATLSELVAILTVLVQSSKTLNQQQKSLLLELKNCNSLLQEQRQEKASNSPSIKTVQRSNKNARLLMGAGIASSLAVILSGVGWLVVRDKLNSERVEWLLHKANRQECVTGVKKPADPQCALFKVGRKS
jgi:hypothetical protein